MHVISLFTNKTLSLNVLDKQVTRLDSNKRFCRDSSNSVGCRSIPIETFGNAYSQVCGKVQGYSYGAAAGFAHRSSTVELVKIMLMELP